MPILMFCLLLWSAPAWAGPAEVAHERARLVSQGKPDLTAKETSDLTMRGWRNRRPGEHTPLIGRLFRPADYLNDVHRGTVDFVSGWRNYSYHLVQIPSGSTVLEVNLSQIAPDTDCVDRTPGIYGHNLTFIDSNLVNCKVYADWTVIGSNTAQIDHIGNLDDPNQVVVEDAVYVADHPSRIPPIRVKPPKVLE